MRITISGPFFCLRRCKKWRERGERLVGLVNGPVVGLKVPLREVLVQGSRRKAVAERHALPCGVSDFCFLFGSDVISLD